MAGTQMRQHAVVVRHARNPDIARISTGWNTFAALAGLLLGGTYVVRVLETPDGQYHITFFYTGGPLA
jgi:hypothetical protein